jgi:hypothetical protein
MLIRTECSWRTRRKTALVNSLVIGVKDLRGSVTLYGLFEAVHAKGRIHVLLILQLNTLRLYQSMTATCALVIKFGHGHISTHCIFNKCSTNSQNIV